MSDDARAGRPAAQLLLAIGAAAGIAGLGVWSIIGSDPAAPEGSRASAPAPEARREPRQLPFALSARALPARTDAGLPLVLLLEARDRSSGAPITTATLPDGLMLEGAPALLAALELGGVAREGSAARELLAGASFDAQGTLALPLRAARAASGPLAITYDGVQITTIEVAWVDPPDAVVLVLPGQHLEAGRVVGTPDTQRPGVAFQARIVPVRDGAPTEFASMRALKATVDGGAQRDVVLRGDTLIEVNVESATSGARVVLEGLPTGRCESAPFDVQTERRS